MKPYLRLLSEDDLKNIHNASLRILEQTGMLIDHEEARKLLEAAGAEVDHEEKTVRFPPQLVEERLKLVPRKLVHHGRTPEYDITIETGGDVYSRTPGGATAYVGLRTGEHRRARLDDWKEFATLADALPNIHSLGTLHCGDVPEQTADIHSLHVLLEYQRKNIVHNAFSMNNFKVMIEMMLALRGSREELQKRPLVHHIISPISPLFLNEDDTAQLLLACEYGIPTDIPIMPTTGTTAPITIAGTLALSNAEFLGTMTLAQTARPGHSMPYFLDPPVADMKTGAPLMGAPEVGLLNAAIAQLGCEFYDLPPEGIGMTPDGLIFEQTLFQKASNMVMQCLAGGKLIIGAGVIDTCMAASPVQLVIDDEIMGIARRLSQGIKVNEDTLAVDAIDRVGPRGHFLSDLHTLQHLRTGELIRTEIFDRDLRDIWVSKGAKGLEQKAREKALAILDKHEVEPLPEDVVEELKSIVGKADQQLAET
jgi:trimethylamine--corrinoid protein Co-methyltransferase